MSLLRVLYTSKGKVKILTSEAFNTDPYHTKSFISVTCKQGMSTIGIYTHCTYYTLPLRCDHQVGKERYANGYAAALIHAIDVIIRRSSSVFTETLAGRFCHLTMEQCMYLPCFQVSCSYWKLVVDWYEPTWNTYQSMKQASINVKLHLFKISSSVSL